MPRSLRSTLLENRTSRLKLQIRKKPYSVRVAPGIRLAYRRNPTAGVCSVIAASNGSTSLKKFALVDDHEDADGTHVLSFWQAQKQARQLARGDIDSDPNHPATVRGALATYRRNLEGRGQPTTFVRRFERELPAALLAKPVALLSARELSAIRDDWAVRCKPLSVNRMASALKAALNHAAALDERIANAKAWARGSRIAHQACSGNSDRTLGS
jgi:hypothetical protein